MNCRSIPRCESAGTVVGACSEVPSTQRPRRCIQPRCLPEAQAVGPNHPRSCGKAGGGPRSEVYCDEEEPVLEDVSKQADNGVMHETGHDFLYSSVDETATKSLSEAGTQVARTIQEFLRAVCSME